ncbi:PREDICTED: LON peptidase N-terminal domain and RING finger protein 1-like [Diuraphis noxia]|uniref:LON peptidase N-terminal domain and RING finger protein 1-like n=1 Tax=Diuraphis noxia TaxID=143948 RepID=UPI0007638AE6|nr:PREDICTED: LON peptidase N-terminal domain and RING finger protein 1-like [Diuraphis noxia]XP_015363451.1 PREDICTED: LON peptidase N-terminal domain and RING finger protein 1-like [Diuraphis noxia]
MMMQYSEICMYYLRGVCRFGSRCWNSHDLNHRSPKTQALAAAATESYYEESHSITSPETNTSTSTSSTTSTSTSASASASINTSASTSASTSGKSTPVQAQGLQLLLEASMKPILKQSDDSEMEIEKVATDLSVAMKKGNGKSVKKAASKLHALHKKKKKGSTENDNSPWNNIIRCAIDNDLQCNICFEIFIKPTVLNCSHTFCESCIHVWTKRVKKCPICRVHIKSKSYCLTLDTFIEKIVEQLPKEIKHKRGLAIKDRSKMKIDKPRSSNRFNGIDLAALLSLEELIEADSPLQFLESDEEDEEDDDIDEDMIVEESEMFRMNLHDTVVSTRGVNPLMSYVVGAEEETSNESMTQPRNSSAP